MKYRVLGKTGMTVSVVGIGAWQFGGEWGGNFTESDVDAIIKKGKDCGINLIDTAECYGDHLSESLVGRAVEKERDQWIVATKFGHRFHGHLERTWHWQPDEVRQQLDESLRALRTDYVDLYQFHSGDDAAFNTEGLWEMLAEEVERGRIRHLGISIGSNANVYQTDSASRVNAEAIQVVYNRLDTTPEEEVFPSCRRQDLGVLARVPLASGYLSGKYKPGATFADNDVRANHEQSERERKLRQVQSILDGEVPEGTNMAAWALAWCLKHPAVTCVIPGCKSPEQVEANAGAADLSMVPEDHPQAQT